MKTQKFTKAFEKMSSGDQAAVRSAIFETEKSATCCCSEAEMGQLKGMMAKMEASENMASMCHEMMRMCQEKMASKSCTLEGSGQSR